jgi:cell fate regulator YaaT (PSP1 superfamily)
MRLMGVCEATGKKGYARGTRVVVRTARGLEAGEVLCVATGEATAGLKNTAKGQILRAMTGDDRNELGRIHTQEREEFQVCLRCIDELGLKMQLVEVEHVFGGERIVVYYLAESRVDFRELVKRLASEFQTRIEMRQIGVRDEAKLLADYGDCGKPVCCNNHLANMPPVSMKMAKLQKATLDPTKISGRCGRLKCCLRFEYDTYEELQKQFPPIGSQVETEDGRGRVLGHEIIAGQLLVETSNRTRKLVDWSTVKPVPADNDSKKPAQTETVGNDSKKPAQTKPAGNDSKEPAQTKPADNGKS